MPALRRLALAAVILIVVCAAGAYLFNRYWVHRFDALIARQAAVYRLDPDLVWSIIYEETYFRPWMKGDAGEVGLMQVTPTVGREWAAETGMRELAEQMRRDPESALADPERNIQVGCWYLEKLRNNYRSFPAENAMSLAAYNAGASRVEEWTRGLDASKLTRQEFIERINISSTKAYVTSILERYDGN